MILLETYMLIEIESDWILILDGINNTVHLSSESWFHPLEH